MLQWISPDSLSHSSFIQHHVSSTSLCHAQRSSNFKSSVRDEAAMEHWGWTGWCRFKMDLDVKSIGLCWLMGCVKVTQRRWALENREAKNTEAGIMAKCNWAWGGIAHRGREHGWGKLKGWWQLGAQSQCSGLPGPLKPQVWFHQLSSLFCSPLHLLNPIWFEHRQKWPPKA